MHSQPTELLLLNQELAEHWVLVPCQGKRPLVPWKDLHEASPTRVKEWIAEFPEANWAVKVGPVSKGLIAVDVDALDIESTSKISPKIGAYAEFIRVLANRVPVTLWHETRQGYHFLFTLSERDLRDLRQKIVIPLKKAKVEVLLRDHLVLIPPSVIDGFRYVWRMPPGSESARRRQPPKVPTKCWPAKAPKWLLKLIERSTAKDSTPTESKPRTVLDVLATNEQLAKFIHDYVGKPYPGVHKAFRCILPGHHERHPSAAWWRGENGSLWYHDFHRRSGYEWYGIAEVWHAVRTGQTRRLDPREIPGELTVLAGQAGILGPTVECLCLEWEKILDENSRGAGSLLLELVAIAHTFLQLFREEAVRGGLVVMASNRWLAKHAGVHPFVASKVVNALALLGMVQKLDLPPYAGRRYATRWVLCTPDPEGFHRGLELLKDVPLHQLNRELASEFFGKTAAEEVFRRAP